MEKAPRPDEPQLVLAENANGSPIYFKEHTVTNDNKDYDVMILIKPKENGDNPPHTAGEKIASQTTKPN